MLLKDRHPKVGCAASWKSTVCGNATCLMYSVLAA